MITRSQVANYIVDNLADNRHSAIRIAAAWIANGRSSQIDYLVRDVASIMEDRGYLYARITTSDQITAATLHQVKRYLEHESGAKEVEIDASVDPGLIGGLIIDTPTARLSTSIRESLNSMVQKVGAHE